MWESKIIGICFVSYFAIHKTVTLWKSLLNKRKINCSLNPAYLPKLTTHVEKKTNESNKKETLKILNSNILTIMFGHLQLLEKDGVISGSLRRDWWHYFWWPWQLTSKLFISFTYYLISSLTNIISKCKNYFFCFLRFQYKTAEPIPMKFSMTIDCDTVVLFNATFHPSAGSCSLKTRTKSSRKL